MTTFFTLHNQQTIAQPALSGLSPLDTSRGVRVVKDVLRVGTWKAGERDWVVTDDTLKTLANDFAAMLANGVRSSLYWGGRPDGGALGQHGVEAKNAIAPIDQVFAQDGVLYCSCYVTDEQAKLLSNPAHQVSVGVKPNWEDGQHKTYSLALLHVAIVDQPVVTGQGPFLMLSNESHEDDMTAELKTLIEGQATTIKTMAEGLITLSNEFKTFRSEQETKKANAAKDAWGAKLKTLFDGKKIDAATMTTYEGLGAEVAYNLALLAPLDNVIMLANESEAQRHAKKDDADLTAKPALESDEVVAARIKARGINTDLMPKLGV